MKDKRVTIRFTDEEYEVLKTRQALEGYMSTAKFIREKVLYAQSILKPTSIYTGKLAKEILSLTKQVKKIGVNYNQVVKKFNSMSYAYKHIESKKLMVELQDLTKNLIDQVKELKEEVINNGNQTS